MLAYLFWHRPAAAAQTGSYEDRLERFHRSLAHQPPSGFRGSASFRLDGFPWRPAQADDRPGLAYEDWYVVEDWTAIGVLEEAAVSRGHVSAHQAVASHADGGAGAVYRLLEGTARVELARHAVWVSGSDTRERPSFAALLGDGLNPREDGLWQRCLVLGPAPEYCLLADEPSAGVEASRLPAGWTAHRVGRDPVWNG